MAACKRVYAYAASLVGRKESKEGNEVVIDLRRHFSS